MSKYDRKVWNCVFLRHADREVWADDQEKRDANRGAGMCNTGWGEENRILIVCALGGLGCNVDHTAILWELVAA